MLYSNTIDEFIDEPYLVNGEQLSQRQYITAGQSWSQTATGQQASPALVGEYT